MAKMTVKRAVKNAYKSLPNIFTAMDLIRKTKSILYAYERDALESNIQRRFRELRQDLVISYEYDRKYEVYRKIPMAKSRESASKGGEIKDLYTQGKYRTQW